MDDQNNELLNDFTTEALEHLESIDEKLLAIEKDPKDRTAVDEVFRSVHSIKGIAGFLELNRIADLCHKMESTLNLFREDHFEPQFEHVDLLLTGCDLVRTMVRLLSQGQSENDLTDDQKKAYDQVSQGLARLLNNQKEMEAPTTPEPEDAASNLELLPEFLIEAYENIEIAERSLVQLDREKEQVQHLHELFRAIHTIKGSSSYMRIHEIMDLTHVFEEVLSALRSQNDPPTSEHIDLFFESMDMMKMQLQALSNQEPVPTADSLSVRLRALSVLIQAGLERSHPAPTSSSSSQWDVFSAIAQQQLSAIRFWTEKHSGNQDPAHNESFILFRAARFLKVSSQNSGFREFSQFAAQIEDLVLDPSKRVNGLNLQDSLFEKLQKIEEKILLYTHSPHLLNAVPEFAEEVSTPGEAKQQALGSEQKTIRIDQGLLDVFMNLVGELIVTKNALEQVQRAVSTSQNPAASTAFRDLRQVTKNVIQISQEMQGCVMKMRMIPAKSVFQRFPRMLRDIIAKNGKDIDLIMEGEETEIEKGIAEGITDPLVHMFRNAIDHGVESPEDRKKIGKNPKGKVIVRAKHEAGKLVIELIDDGKGMNPDKIMKKAIEKGLTTEEEAKRLTREQILNFIFLPGFSTAEKVTDISGRGVGMDVVNTNLKKVNGKLTIQTEVDQGTTFRIELPLTMAVVDALLFNVEKETYAVPVHSVYETVKIPKTEMKSVMNHKAISLRGQILTVHWLPELMNKVQDLATTPDQLAILVLENAGRKMGLVIDKVLRQEQLVIKPLPAQWADCNFGSGTAVLGDGRAILILDTDRLGVEAPLAA